MAYAIFVLAAVLSVVAVYATAIGWLYFRQERLLFEPETLAADACISEEADVHEHWIDVPGARLSAAQLKLPAPRGVVFFLHGNSGHLQRWMAGLDAFREANFDLVMFDYRGFGKSGGRIESEAQLQADVAAVWAHFAPQYAGRPVVIGGQSLGTGLAAALAAQLCAAGRAPQLTLMVSPYSSMQALADEHYPWVPSAVLRYRLASLEHVARLSCRLLLVHGDRDELIGIHHSQALAQAMPGAQLLRVEGAGHSDVHQFPSYRQGVAAALAGL